MAESLKNQFGIEIPQKIAAMVAEVTPNFATETFLNEVLDGYDDLDLMPRGRKIAEALYHHLPSNYKEAADVLKEAADVLIASLGPKLEETKQSGMEPFLYLPHVLFVAKYGLKHFETSMQAQDELTQRFTAEFSIRPFLERYPEATLARLKTWTQDPSTYVRRLVSEGTRPRLPWAPRLREFQKNPYPVLELLELLKDDPELYVRRSVANNLNDIGKDHPSLLVETAHRWLVNATDERRWLIRLCESESQDKPQGFQVKDRWTCTGETIQLGKAISLANMTTRKHYPGSHLIEILLNGQTVPLGSFELMRTLPPQYFLVKL